MNDTNTRISWGQVREKSLAARTDAERAEYDAAANDAEVRPQLAELMYNARTAIEYGAQAPGGVMLARIAHARGGILSLNLAA